MPPKKQTSKPISLNEEQQAVVAAGTGFWKVLAGPGAGKSACLVHRYLRLLQEGVDPSDILALSFTATAAKNLKDRVEAQAGKLSTIRKSGSATLHSLALAFVIEEREHLGYDIAEFPLATESSTGRLCALASKRFDANSRDLRAYLSLQKRSHISPSQAIKSAEGVLDAKQLKLALAYKHYEAGLRSEGLMDFDGLMYQMVEVMAKKPDVRPRWQYRFVMADESQDNCQLDWSLLKLLSEKHGNLLCVGDPGQNIFSFRGADADLFMEMDKLFSGTQTLFLGTNYRSSPEIVSFIQPYAASQELAGKFRTQNASGPVPIIQGFQTASQECAWIVERIKETQ
jgi:DNA helicase-2/ATP-dependent DNA helicase PcrA